MKPFVAVVALLVLAATAAAQGGGQSHPADCPKANIITIMMSAMQAFRDALPLDRSSLKACGAQLSKDGKELRVCLANGDFAIADMANSFVLPLKHKGQFILQVNFSNGAGIVPGKYDPAAGYGKPFWVTGEVKVPLGEKGTIVMLGAREGTAEIIAMSGSTVCGRFHLKTVAGHPQPSEVAGEFNVPMERSRW
ncbi:MAG: hypothetical protein MUC72_07505 [Acidobacteria bacterium]|jgi:hypothetical protein|nr:hypothetical protein [Acidobacteriota bacterium]